MEEITKDAGPQCALRPLDVNTLGVYGVAEEHQTMTPILSVTPSNTRHRKGLSSTLKQFIVKSDTNFRANPAFGCQNTIYVNHYNLHVQ